MPTSSTSAARPAARAAISLRIKSSPAEIAPVRRAIEAICLEHGAGEAATAQVGLCVNEALANVIRHAYDGQLDKAIVIDAHVDFSSDRSASLSQRASSSAASARLPSSRVVGPVEIPQRGASPGASVVGPVAGPQAFLEVTIRDWGNGRAPRELPLEPRDPLTPGGLGLVCLRRLMDEVMFTPQPDGMLLTLRKKLVG